VPTHKSLKIFRFLVTWTFEPRLQNTDLVSKLKFFLNFSLEKGFDFFAVCLWFAIPIPNSNSQFPRFEYLNWFAGTTQSFA